MAAAVLFERLGDDLADFALFFNGLQLQPLGQRWRQIDRLLLALGTLDCWTSKLLVV